MHIEIEEIIIMLKKFLIQGPKKSKKAWITFISRESSY